MTRSPAKTTSPQVETLAKLYLDSPPAEIRDEIIAQLCDWLMDEFQQLPLNLQFSDYSPTKLGWDRGCGGCAPTQGFYPCTP